MSGIFISYCRETGATVKTLAEDLERLGHTVWFDQDLSGGRAWWDQILAQIRACDLLVFALSSEALTSTACDREWRYAAALGKPILPVLAANGVSTNLLPPRLSTIQHVDYCKQDRESAFSLAKALRDVPPPSPLPDPLPEAPEAPVSYLGGLSERIEAKASLTYEEQSALVSDLRQGLRDPETASDARTLLDRLRKRRDLFATTADEIDDLRARATATLAVRPVPDVTGHTVEGRAGPSLAEQGRRPDSRAVEPPAAPPALPATSPTGTRRDRLIGSLVGAAVLIVLGPGQWMAYGYGLSIEQLIVFAASGAVAGAITARNQRVIVAAAVGTILVGWVVSPMMQQMGFPLYVGIVDLAIPVGAILGATVGAALRRLKKWP